MALRFYILSLVIGFSIFSCKPKEEDTPNDENEGLGIEVPDYFPKMPVPEDNQFTSARILLGRQLFFDKNISKDSTVSCGSCHLPEKAFTDGLALSPGVEGRTGNRNTMPLFNAAYHSSFFWDGGVPSLELQVIAPIENPLEMDISIDEVLQRLNGDPQYVQMFNEAYGRNPDLFSLTRAIACYERTLISGASKYDRYFYLREFGALNSQEVRGMELFLSDDSHCATCHNGFHFSNFNFENNGFKNNYDADKGRQRITLNYYDTGKFKVPSLRNVGLTAPYMHDGSMATLEEVVEHYNNGGTGHWNQSPHVHPLNLNEQQKADLVAFLKALSADVIEAK
jgi:cytochrome c peroxidase